MAKQSKRQNSVIKIILTDIAGVLCLALVPIIGPLPGPGGIPLLLTGFGLLAINHDWADGAIHYINKHSESLQSVVFPDVKWVKLAWDALVIILIVSGTWLNVIAENWFWSLFSYAILASSTTIFMLNRNRLAWLDKQIRRFGKK